MPRGRALREKLGGTHEHYAPLLNEDEMPQQQEFLARSNWVKRLILCNAAMFLASFCCALVSVLLFLRSRGEMNILDQTTFYSIATNNLNPTWSGKKMITYPLDSQQSLLRHEPNDEVDETWERLTDFGVLAISSQDVKKLGKDPATVIQAPESWGRGSDAYVAQLDGVHLLHCLDSLRKSLYYNFERFHPDGISRTYRAHLGHCQESLARHLMCQPSVELLTYNWVERLDNPFPDFDINKKCWDYEQLLDWQEEHRIPNMTKEMWRAMERPDDVTPLPVPLLMLEAYNVTLEEAETMP